MSEIENKIITGKTPSTADASNFGGEIPFITIDDIRQNLFVVKTEKTLSTKGAATQKNKFIAEGAICVTCIATIGLVGFASKSSQTNQQINSVECEYEFNKYYLYFAIKNYFEFGYGAKTGNTFSNMNKGDFENIVLLSPSIKILKKFHLMVNPLFGKIHNNIKQNQTLASFRDWLLPMLMNGQVSVGEAYEKVAAAMSVAAEGEGAEYSNKRNTTSYTK